MRIATIAVAPRKTASARAATPVVKKTSSNRTLIRRHRRLHSGTLKLDQAFSWTHCLISLVSYALLVSDVARAGLGIRSVGFHTFLPNTYVFFGPLAYQTNHLTRHNATSNTFNRFWPYKYDTTSVAMRSVVKFFEVSHWSPCLLYQARCDESVGLSHSSVFAMIDALVDEVSSRSVKSQEVDSSFTLRIEYRYRDRLHHYAFPWFFEPTVKRTSRVTYLALQSGQNKFSFCSPRYPKQRQYSCAEHWTQYERLQRKPRGGERSRATRIWDDILERQAQLISLYPDHVVDLVLLDSMDDPTRERNSFHGRKYFDIVVLTRIRHFDESGDKQILQTVAIDDFRYEAASFIIDAPDWFIVVALLRGFGQLYIWVRIIMLLLGCYNASSRFRPVVPLSPSSRMLSMLRVAFLIPSQVVIYGSRLPILAYMIAHLADSAAGYEIIAAHFNSWLGLINFNMGDIVQQCAVSMRTVWILGYLCHFLLSTLTQRTWSPIHGVPGIAELSITFVASFTVFAQYRSTSLRSTQILQVHEIVPSLHHQIIRSQTHGYPRNLINNLIFSSTIDAQSLACGFSALFAITLLLRTLRSACSSRFPFQPSVVSRTIVPYSAGTLWPRNSLAVSWFGALILRQPSTRDLDCMTFSGSTVPPLLGDTAFPSIGRPRRTLVQRQLRGQPGLIMSRSYISLEVQRDMQNIHTRSRDIESRIYLINLAVMTDPATFFALRLGHGRLVSIFVSNVTNQCFVLPSQLVTSQADIPIDWHELQLITVVNTKNLEWHDLLACG